MALAAFSPEVRILNGLRELNCSWHAFAKISSIVGKTRLHEALGGLNDLEQKDAERLLDILSRMKELHQQLPADLQSVSSINWSDHETIRAALALRLAAKIAKEFGDTTLDEAAARATEQVGNGSN